MYYSVFNINQLEITLVGDQNGLTELWLSKDSTERSHELNSYWTRDDAFFDEIKKQIIEFFNKERKDFDIKLNPQGTEFQKKVWKELTNIPAGELRSYKDIATAIGNPKASRAVGMANNKNPIPIIIPCHRVVGSNGKLVGYAYGLDIKQKLIDIENETSC
jgi:methylated-DNA-[protein]-cysteine S-methyltransferase